MKILKLLFLSLLHLNLIISIENGLGKKPQMGWNPWNVYGCNINEELMRQNMDALVSSGLADAGYIYFNLDDCWQSSRDKFTQRIQADPIKFPSGILALTQYAHSKGLKFGLYSDAGYLTCEGRPGSLGFEQIDALQYAEWDIDYLKYDNCFNGDIPPKIRYPPMAKALMAQKKKIFFSMCEWGFDEPAQWAGALSNSWRTTGDIKDNWDSFIEILDLQVGLEIYAGPGGWNDPDMLEVGNGGMTTSEYQAHFALWSLLKAPLLIGCDIPKMTTETRNILLNKEIIAINQDSLGKQGRRVQKIGDLEVWAGDVIDGGEGVAVILFNRSSSKQNITVQLTDIGITGTTIGRDLINRTDLGQIQGSFSAEVESHACVMVKLTKS